MTQAEYQQTIPEWRAFICMLKSMHPDYYDVSFGRKVVYGYSPQVQSGVDVLSCKARRNLV